MGILERGPKSVGSKVRVKVVDNTKKKTLQSEVREHVLAGSAVFTDALASYDGLDGPQRTTRLVEANGGNARCRPAG